MKRKPIHYHYLDSSEFGDAVSWVCCARLEDDDEAVDFNQPLLK